MQARRLALLRRHEADNAVLPARFDVQADRLLAEQEERVELLEAQLKIERGRQKTNAIRFNVIADLDSRLADARVTKRFKVLIWKSSWLTICTKTTWSKDLFEVDASAELSGDTLMAFVQNMAVRTAAQAGSRERYRATGFAGLHAGWRDVTNAGR